MVLTHSPVNFQNPATRVRINPETLLRFEKDRMVILQHPTSEQTMRIQYDIMLILYEMVGWITVGDLCHGWPPEDQAKIKDHLAMLYQSKIVVTDESEVYDQPPPALPVSIGNTVSINVENHHAMLRDSMRMASYRWALEKAVLPDSVVLDLGAGTGILSFFAAKAGAQKVFSIEKRADMVRLARELAQANGLDNRVTFIENSSHLVPPETLVPKPTLMVSEILGNAILEENILEFTIDARDRLLAPEGRMIPAGLEIMLVAFDAGTGVDKSLEVTELEAIYGLKLDLLKTVFAQKPFLKLERFNPAMYTLMSDPVSVIHLDLKTIRTPTFTQPLSLTMTRTGHVNGFCAYFRAHLDAETVLTNSPWAPPTHWTQMVFLFPTRRAVQAGESLAMELVYDGGLLLWYQEDRTS